MPHASVKGLNMTLIVSLLWALLSFGMPAAMPVPAAHHLGVSSGSSASSAAGGVHHAGRRPMDGASGGPA